MRAKRYGLEIVLAAFFVLLLTPAVEAVLPVGTGFEFSDSKLLSKSIEDGESFEYTHYLTSDVFFPSLEGGETISIYGAGLGIIELSVELDNPNESFTLEAWWVLEHDPDISLGSKSHTTEPFFDVWQISLPDEVITLLESDREGTIRIEATKGSTVIGHSILAGQGIVVPEPATLLLLGSGLIGLAGFGRKKKEEEV